jgi:energy-coupling factor transporter ATP-binding protein EcfA2
MSCAINVNNLSFSYPDGKEALRNICFSVHEGECVAIIGPNGSGKSTLLLHLNGILPEEPADQPAVRVFDQPVSKSVMDTIRRKVGLLFQDPDDQLFCPTVYEDVAFGPRQFGVREEDVRLIVTGALKQAGIDGFENRSPHHLSGGEKQRVCLAGILACEPALLALDEPTSDLDPRGKRELKKFLRSLPATKIIATHDLELVVELCPRTIILDGGCIVADGGTIDLLNNEEFMLAHGLERPHILQHRHPHH